MLCLPLGRLSFWLYFCLCLLGCTQRTRSLAGCLLIVFKFCNIYACAQRCRDTHQKCRHSKECSVKNNSMCTFREFSGISPVAEHASLHFSTVANLLSKEVVLDTLVREKNLECCFFMTVSGLVIIAKVGQKQHHAPHWLYSVYHEWIWVTLLISGTLRFLFPQNNFMFFVHFFLFELCRKIYGLRDLLVMSIAIFSPTLTLCIFLLSEKILNFDTIACLHFLILCLFKSWSLH